MCLVAELAEELSSSLTLVGRRRNGSGSTSDGAMQSGDVEVVDALVMVHLSLNAIDGLLESTVSGLLVVEGGDDDATLELLRFDDGVSDGDSGDEECEIEE